MTSLKLKLVLFSLSAVMTTPAIAKPSAEPYSKLAGRDCADAITCHVSFPKVGKNFRLDIETVSCVTTTTLNLPVTFQAIYVGDAEGANVALYGVTPVSITKNDIIQFVSFNQHGYMPVFGGQTLRVET